MVHGKESRTGWTRSLYRVGHSQCLWGGARLPCVMSRCGSDTEVDLRSIPKAHINSIRCDSVLFAILGLGKWAPADPRRSLDRQFS